MIGATVTLGRSYLPTSTGTITRSTPTQWVVAMDDGREARLRRDTMAEIGSGCISAYRIVDASEVEAERELLLERVNAVPRPRIADGRTWSIVDGGLHLGGSGNLAHVMMDRGGATSVAAIASTADVRQLIDHVDAVANIVREHYDREANGSTNR